MTEENSPLELGDQKPVDAETPNSANPEQTAENNVNESVVKNETTSETSSTPPPTKRTSVDWKEHLRSAGHPLTTSSEEIIEKSNSKRNSLPHRKFSFGGENKDQPSTQQPGRAIILENKRKSKRLSLDATTQQPIGILIQEPTPTCTQTSSTSTTSSSTPHVKFGEQVEVSPDASEEEGGNNNVKYHKRASSLDTQNLQTLKSSAEHSPRSLSPKGDPIEKSYSQSHRIDLTITKGKMTRKGSRDDLCIHKEVSVPISFARHAERPHTDDGRLLKGSSPITASEGLSVKVARGRRNSSSDTPNPHASKQTNSSFGSIRSLVGGQKKKKDALIANMFDKSQLILSIVLEEKTHDFDKYDAQLTLTDFLQSEKIKVTTQVAKNQQGELLDFNSKLVDLIGESQYNYFIFIIPQEPTSPHNGTREYLIGLNGLIRSRNYIYRKRTDMELKSVENFLNSEEIKSSFKRQMAARKKKVNKLKESQNDRIKLQNQPSFLETLISQKKFTSDVLVTQEDDHGVTRVVAGTLEALIELLTHEDGRDKQFEMDFIWSFDSMLTPFNLFERLTQRYKEGSVKVKEHVLEVYKYWITKRKYCFEEPQMKEAFLAWYLEVKETDFAQQDYMDPMKVMGFTLYIESEVSSSTRAVEMAKIERSLMEDEVECAPDILVFVHDKVDQKCDFLDYHPFEFARQLTLIDFQHFKKIKAHEWIGKGLTNGKSVNVLAFINRFNEFSGWISSMVCLGPTLEIRCLAIKYFLACALELVTFNNFNAAMAIVSGLSMGPVVRLLQTWNALGSGALKWFELIKELMGMEKNFKTLRSFEEQLEYCIPYLGMYTKDLIFIEDGNPDMSEGLINFDKRHMVATVISKMEHFGGLRYSLAPVPEMQKYLELFFCVNEDDLYVESFQRESKEMNAKLKEKNAKKGIY